jgi:transcriptional repressor NrdR
VRCPFCASVQDDKVIDSREAKDGSEIRRRRECSGCVRRFTTYERVAEILPQIVKKDGRREQWQREKIVSGVKRACEKRPVSVQDIERVADEIERELQDSGDKEIPASRVGEAVMGKLRQLDEVAYVRFASVYRSFRDISEFMSALSEILRGRESR